MPMLLAPLTSSQTTSVSPAQHNYSVTWWQIERRFSKIGLYAILSHMSSGPFIWIQYALGISLIWGKVPHCCFSHGIVVTVFGVTVSLFLARARSPVSWNICSLHRYEENLKVSLFFSKSLLICQLKHMFIIQIWWKSFGGARDATCPHTATYRHQ
jgi:hypothetical protein